ncbi:MAG: hypothetical protein ACI304_09035 [Lepagella sp.]
MKTSTTSSRHITGMRSFLRSLIILISSSFSSLRSWIRCRYIPLLSIAIVGTFYGVAIDQDLILFPFAFAALGIIYLVSER